MKQRVEITLRVLVAMLALYGGARAQSVQEPDAKAHTGKSDPTSRVTIEVSGGDKDSPVENASVYLKYVEERKLKKDKKVELNVKTSRERMEDVWAVVRHHRSEADHQGALGKTAAMVLSQRI